MESKPIVAVLDSDFIGWYICSNKKKDVVDELTGEVIDTIEIQKTLEECIEICDSFIDNINMVTNADYYLGFQTRGKCFRYDINPLYKANRKYDNQPKYLQQVKDYLVSKHNFTWDNKYEADDLVISFKRQHPEFECIIVSPDKDILSTPGLHFNPRKMQFKHTTEVEAVKAFWSDMCTGQGGDNIKGIPGKGKVAFEILSKKYKPEEQFIDEFYRANILEMYVKHYGEFEGINEFYKNYRCLKLLENIEVVNYQLNKTNKELSEQTETNREKQEK